MKNIFICHASKNKKAGDLLYSTLLQLGIDSKNIFYSSNYFNGVEVYGTINEFIRQKITECDYCILLLSKELFESNFCLNEIGALWILNKSVLPIIIDDLCLESKIDLVVSDRITVKLSDGIVASQIMLNELNKNLQIENNQKNLLLMENFRNCAINNGNKFSLENIDFKSKNKIQEKKLKKISNNFKKNISNANNLQDILNDVFSSKSFIYALIDSCGANFSYENVAIKISNVLNYYILTRNFDANYYLLFNIMNNVDTQNIFMDKQIVFDGLKNANKTLSGKELCSKLIENYLTDGFITHSCNPYYLNFILQNGLGSKQMKGEAEDNLCDLENVIYKNKFLARQENSAYYYTIPSVNSVHYAIGLSPERVFGGPLKILSRNIDYNNDCSVKDIPPIIVGESLKHYFKKVAKNNLNIVISNNKRLNPLKKIIKNKLYKLVNDFCYDFSYLLLIPTKNNKIMSFNRSVNANKNQTFEYYIKNLVCNTGIDINNIKSLDEAYSLINYIMPKNVGTDDETLMGNLCSNIILTNTQNFLKIKVPSFYSICQFYLKQKYIIGKRIRIKINPYLKDNK